MCLRCQTWPGAENRNLIGAAAAERLNQPLMPEPLAHSSDAGTGENIVQGLVKDIAKSYDALGIQTAGDDRAVHQNGEMIAQTAAVPLPPEIRCGQLRPGKLRFGIEKNSRCQGDAAFRPKSSDSETRNGKSSGQLL